MSGGQRKYSEAEVNKILRLSVTERASLTDPNGMTLEEIVAVAAEVGISENSILDAADRLDSEQNAAPAPWLLGVRPYTELTFVVSGEPNDQNWDEVVAEIRSAFEGPTGSASRLGKTWEWRTGGEFSTTQISLTPSGGRTRIKTRLTAWAVPLFAYGMAVFLGGGLLYAGLWDKSRSLLSQPNLLLGVALLIALLAITRLLIGNWYQSRVRQMVRAQDKIRTVLDSELETTDSSTDDLPDIKAVSQVSL